MERGGSTQGAAGSARSERLEHRRWLLDVDHETSASFDKTLTTLAAGALGVALSVGRGKGIAVDALTCSWGAFGVSLLAMLMSLLTTRRDLSRRIGALDCELRGDGGRARQSPWHEVSTSCLNHVAVVGLVAGVCCLVVFAGMNL